MTKTVKKTDNDIRFIQNGGFCMNCTTERETILRVNEVFVPYQNYKIWTKMIVYGKQKLEELKQSLLDVRPFYEYVNENGSTERWDLPNSVEDTKKEIQDMINTGEGEITELESKRNLAFDVLNNSSSFAETTDLLNATSA